MARKTTFPFDPSLLGCALTFSATLRWISESRNYRRQDDRVSIKILFIFGNIFWTFLKIRKVGKYVTTYAMGICSILNNKTRKRGRMCTIVVRDISSKVINSSVTLDNLFCVISQRSEIYPTNEFARSQVDWFYVLSTSRFHCRETNTWRRWHTHR